MVSEMTPTPRGRSVMQYDAIMTKFEEISKDIADLKSDTKNIHTEVMRLRDWKDNACSDTQPCPTSSKLSLHISDHKEKKSDIQWGASFFIVGLTSVVTAVATTILTRLI